MDKYPKASPGGTACAPNLPTKEQVKASSPPNPIPPIKIVKTATKNNVVLVS